MPGSRTGRPWLSGFMSSTYDPKHFCLHCDDGNGEHVIGRDLGVEPDQVVAEEEVEEGPRRLLGRRTTSGTLKGRVGTATHMPSGQTVAVKCYDLDSLSERDFYEYQSLIRVISGLLDQFPVSGRSEIAAIGPRTR